MMTLRKQKTTQMWNAITRVMRWDIIVTIVLAESENHNKAKQRNSDKESKQVIVTKADIKKSDDYSDAVFMVHDVAFARKSSLLDECYILCDN